MAKSQITNRKENEAIQSFIKELWLVFYVGFIAELVIITTALVIYKGF